VKATAAVQGQMDHCGDNALKVVDGYSGMSTKSNKMKMAKVVLFKIVGKKNIQNRAWL
jgi:hypothetical protein